VARWESEYPFRDWSRTLRTPSGRFEFYSQTLKAALAESSVHDDLLFLPHQAPAEESAAREEFPLVLNIFRPLAFTGGGTSNMPYLIEIAGKGVSVSWDSWVEINPATAQSLGIQDRDLVWVESPVGRVKVKARFYPGALPGVVNLPYGFGHQAGGRWAKGLGVNANDLLEATAMTVAGASVYPITWVKIYKWISIHED
jgi:anaerobic selenocysteine-containing dehydrogenase